MTVFYLLAVDLPSWVLGIDDRSLSCCVQSLLSLSLLFASEGLPFSNRAAHALFLASKEQKTRHVEASFDHYDDDNGTGSKPPPQDRIRYVDVLFSWADASS